MGYADTTGVLFCCKPYQHFVIHISHHVWFGEYNYRLSIEENHTQGSLLLQQDPESIIHHSDLLNFRPCGIDLTSTPFCDTKVLTYLIELYAAI